jgi:hypothetical protein
MQNRGKEITPAEKKNLQFLKLLPPKIKHEVYIIEN